MALRNNYPSPKPPRYMDRNNLRDNDFRRRSTQSNNQRKRPYSPIRSERAGNSKRGRYNYNNLTTVNYNRSSYIPKDNKIDNQRNQTSEQNVKAEIADSTSPNSILIEDNIAFAKDNLFLIEKKKEVDAEMLLVKEHNLDVKKLNDDLNQKHVEMEKTFAQLKNNNVELYKKVELLTRTVEQLEFQRKIYRNDLDKLMKENSDLKAARIKEDPSIIDELNTENAELKTRIQTLKEDCSNMTKDLSMCRQQNDFQLLNTTFVLNDYTGLLKRHQDTTVELENLKKNMEDLEKITKGDNVTQTSSSTFIEVLKAENRKLKEVVLENEALKSETVKLKEQLLESESLKWENVKLKKDQLKHDTLKSENVKLKKDQLKYDALKSENVKLKKKCIALEEENSTATCELNNLTQNFGNFKLRYAELSKELRELRPKVTEKDKEKIKQLSEQVADLKQKGDKSDGEIFQLKGSVEKYTKERSKWRQSCREKELEITQLRVKSNDLEMSNTSYINRYTHMEKENVSFKAKNEKLQIEVKKLRSVLVLSGDLLKKIQEVEDEVESNLNETVVQSAPKMVEIHPKTGVFCLEETWLSLQDCKTANSFTKELICSIFPMEELLNCSFKGMGRENTRPALDAKKVEALNACIIAKFPTYTSVEVTNCCNAKLQKLRQKNEREKKKKQKEFVNK